MKAIGYIFTSVLLAVSILNTQSQITWQESYGGSSTDHNYAICATPDGGSIAANSVKSIDGDITDKHTTDTIDFDLWVVKTNKDGVVEWDKGFGGSQDEKALSVINVSDGGYLITGHTKSNNGDFTNVGFKGNIDIFVMKLDSSGNIEWIKCYGGSGYEVGFNAIENSEGNFLIAGSTYNSGSSGDLAGTSSRGWTDALIIKINTSGGILWVKRYGGNLDDHAGDMVELSNGEYIFACDAESYAGSGEVSSNIGNNHTYDFWILRLNAVGNIVWKKNFGGTSHERPTCISQIGDENFIIAGYSTSTNYDATGNHGGRDGFVIKMDASGTKLWSKSIGGSGDDQFEDILMISDTSFLLTGYTKSNDGDNTGNHGSNDGWIVEINNDGTVISNGCLGSDSDDRLYDIDMLSDKRIVVSGYAGAANGDVIEVDGPADIWVLKLGEPSVYETELMATACSGDSIEFGDVWLKEPGLYYDTLSSVNGVDSVIILTLDFNPSYESENIFSVCEGDSIQFEDQWYNEAGTYYDSLTTIEGCDSVIELRLMVNPKPGSFEIMGEAHPAALQDYLYSVPANAQVIYHWYVENGNIVSSTSNNGVDIQWGEFDTGSALVLAEGNNGCFGDTTVLEADIIMTGVDPFKISEPVLYPNPVQSILNMVLPANLSQKDDRIVIYNMLGEVMVQVETGPDMVKIDVSNWINGAYFLKTIEASSGQVITKRFVVINQ